MKSTGDKDLSKDHRSFIKCIPEPILFFFNHLDVSRGSFTTWHMMTLTGISVVPALLILPLSPILRCNVKLSVADNTA